MEAGSRRRWWSVIVLLLGGAASSVAGPVAEAPPPASLAPIDLASALRLAGVNSPEVLVAQERVDEAVAERQRAALQLLPDINLGSNYDVHTGPLQQSTGNILKVNREALYGGLGAGAVGAGTVSVPGLFLSGNLSESLFRGLVARQLVQERRFRSDAVRNDVLLRVAVGYVELVRAAGRLTLARQTRDETAEVARLTDAYARAGQGRQADADRAATELEERNAEVLEDEAQVTIASARLAQLLDLDPTVQLVPTDGWMVPHPLVPDPLPLPQLVTIALHQRPELLAQQVLIREAVLSLKAARLLPLSPTVSLGYSAGTFGGGSNLAAEGIVQTNGKVQQQPRFGNFNDREDFDVLVYWTLRNLGVGNLALVRLARSRVRIEELRAIEWLDRVGAEVGQAHARVNARYAQIALGEKAVRVSSRAFQEDLARIRGREGLPIEVLNSLRLLGRSRLAYLDAIADYNRAEFELLAALGQPPADCLAHAVPPTLVSPSPVPAPQTAGPCHDH